MATRDGDNWVETLCEAEGLPAHYIDTVRDFVAPLAQQIRGLQRVADRPVLIGLAGAQGSGKSTFARFLANWLTREFELSSVCLSIDDLYFGRAIRATMAASVHPLLATRGVPGTHDVELGHRTLDALTDTTSDAVITLPAFDKANDDHSPEANRPRVQTPVTVVLFEGWCVGARPQDPAALVTPVNALEANADLTGAWRRFVNDRLAQEYAKLFARLDALVMLRVPGFEKVFDWRLEQEQKLRARLRDHAPPGAAPGGQSDDELAIFVMYYERLTRHMLETMPDYADTVIDIDAGHRFVTMTTNGWGQA